MRLGLLSTPVLVSELNSTGDVGMSLVASGETMFYAAAVATGGNAEIWSATRRRLPR